MVVPTKGRPKLLLRAINSALRQTYAEIEVVVVVDGVDSPTAAALQSLKDPRLRVIALAKGVGGSEARNIGVRAATGAWIALLDDDDEWYPEKIEMQLACALRSRYRCPVVSSRFVARSSRGDEVLPRRLYKAGSIAEYLFERRGLRYGDGLLHTSTLLMARDLLLQVPFQPGLKRHQDWDLVLRLARHPGVGIEMLADAVAIVHMDEHRPGVSRVGGWEFSLTWARERRAWMGSRHYSFFIATECMPRAAKNSATWRQRLLLMKECALVGSPTWRSLLLALLFAVQRPVGQGVQSSL